MRFRPLPVLTLAAAPALALLITLGVWQVQRAGWKAELIAGLEARAAGPAVPLAEALCAGEGAGGPVQVDLALQGPEIRMYGPGPQGEPGWMLLRAAAAPGCAAAPVQTGFAPLDGEARAAPERLTLEPWPEIGAFTPQNAAERGEYYRFDRAALAAAFDLPPEDLAPVWARWDARSPAEQARIAPETHIGYAVTWFGLAAALIGVYLALHARLGRLSLRR